MKYLDGRPGRRRCKRPPRWNQVALVMLPVLAACQALGPAFTSALVSFGQDLLSTTALNYRPQYAESVSNLLLAMAQSTTGLEFTALPDNYYAMRRQRMEQQRQQNAHDQQQQQYAQQQYGQPPGYGQATYGQPAYDQAGYDQPDYDQPDYDQSGYDQSGYDQQGYDQPAYDQAGYDQTDQEQPDVNQYGYPPSDDAYAQSYDYATVRSPSGLPDPGASPSSPPPPITLDVALLAQTLDSSGAVGLTEVADGDVLHDGGADPAAGDKIKLSFRSSCDCHLYVIGIDATGWVTRIYPSPGDPVLPLSAEKDYLLPAGNTWWGLDQYKGVEQIYFILSAQRRTDIEQALAALPDERPVVPTTYRSIREPAVVPVRGMVKVQSPGPTTVPTALGAQQVSPTSFVGAMDSADLVVTRWFHHR